MLEELSRQTRVLYRDHLEEEEDDDERHEDDEDAGDSINAVTEEDGDYVGEDVRARRRRGTRNSRIVRMESMGSVVDPLVEMAEEVVDGDGDDDDVFRTKEREW